jgi:hypothetical protein
MTVKHKQNQTVYDVYDISYSTNSRGEPIAFFLVYLGSKFQMMLASEFEPYTEEPKYMVKKTLYESINKEYKFEDGM